jgi:diadenosine tetraphosphate (Ap4A) HIT family hydrolase
MIGFRSGDPSVQTLIHERVASARAGANPTVIGRLRSGWVVLGDSQHLRGYCLLLPDPVVPSVNHLRGSERAIFLADMVAVGDALLAVTDAIRINYEILGNSDPALHAHIFPRYTTEPEPYRSGPVWNYERGLRASVPFDGERDHALMREIFEALGGIGIEEPGPIVDV